jgi:ABC-type uncharacterized transport system substrate-binding protein
MRRRDLITLFGGVAAIWPLSAKAQQPSKRPTIGFLGANASGFAPWVSAFVARMRELGWIDGRTIAIEYRWSEGRPERYAEIAVEFVRLNVDVIVTVGSAVPIVKQATSVIPIVFAVGIDPVGSGLVASLAKPGGNVTGLSIQANELAGKRLELLREVMPQLRRPILRSALGERMPTIFSTSDFVRNGALISYGPSYSDLFRHSADLVDKILRGTKPADIPVEQPTKFELVINLTTANALDLKIPPSLLARADEVIE